LSSVVIEAEYSWQVGLSSVICTRQKILLYLIICLDSDKTPESPICSQQCNKMIQVIKQLIFRIKLHKNGLRFENNSDFYLQELNTMPLSPDLYITA
jgi:hypothetical protein